MTTPILNQSLIDLTTLLEAYTNKHLNTDIHSIYSNDSESLFSETVTEANLLDPFSSDCSFIDYHPKDGNNLLTPLTNSLA